MIAYIEGPLKHKDPTYVVIDINGVGYLIKISLNTFSKIKALDKVKLYTHLHIKEDAHTLYGFYTEEEKQIFLNLISISGVGPNTGIMINSSLSVSELKKAILNGDVKTIQSVKGIGGKTAQRIIIELKDKISKEGFELSTETLSGNEYNTLKSEALTALITLGISKNIAEKSIDNILKSNANGITLEELIKQVLKRA